MIRYITRESNKDVLREIKHPASFEQTWVYGEGIVKSDIDGLAEDFSLNQGILRDIFDQQELPRAEYDGSTLYLFVRVPRRRANNKGVVTSSPLLLILKNSTLFSLATSPYFSADDLAERYQVTTKSSRHTLVQALSYIVWQYEELVDDAQLYINGAGQRLETHQVTNKDFVKFVTVERNLNEYHTNLSAMLVVLQRLADNKHGTFGEKDLDIIDDIVLYINQLRVSIESQGKLVGSIRDAYTTISNNNLNVRLKALTLLTVIIALPNVFYGMYGMNVALPFAEQPWAYAAITGLTLGVVALVYTIARRRF